MARELHGEVAGHATQARPHQAEGNAAGQQLSRRSCDGTSAHARVQHCARPHSQPVGPADDVIVGIASPPPSPPP
eukprot:2884589-Pleurochrysis_carterae.AAC.1